jgi:hypothetical protein
MCQIIARLYWDMFGRAGGRSCYGLINCVPVKELGVASFHLTKQVVCYFFMELSDRMIQEGECKSVSVRAIK